MEVFKSKGKGVIYNRHFPAEMPARRPKEFIRQGGLNLSAFSQSDAARLREVNPKMFNSFFTAEEVPEKRKRYEPQEPTE